MDLVGNDEDTLYEKIEHIAGSFSGKWYEQIT